MTKEEKEKILDYIDRQINYQDQSDDYALGENYAYRDIYEYIGDMPITETKETNLEHFVNDIINDYDKLRDKMLTDSALTSALQTYYFEYSDPSLGVIQDMLHWYCEEYKKPKYKLSKFEYDLLDTNDSKDKTFGSFNTYGYMKKRGYFEDIPDDATIKDILKYCEVAE